MRVSGPGAARAPPPALLHAQRGSPFPATATRATSGEDRLRQVHAPAPAVPCTRLRVFIGPPPVPPRPCLQAVVSALGAVVAESVQLRFRVQPHVETALVPDPPSSAAAFLVRGSLLPVAAAAAAAVSAAAPSSSCAGAGPGGMAGAGCGGRAASTSGAPALSSALQAGPADDGPREGVMLPRPLHPSQASPSPSPSRSPRPGPMASGGGTPAAAVTPRGTGLGGLAPSAQQVPLQPQPQPQASVLHAHPFPMDDTLLQRLVAQLPVPAGLVVADSAVHLQVGAGGKGLIVGAGRVAGGGGRKGRGPTAWEARAGRAGRTSSACTLYCWDCWSIIVSGKVCCMGIWAWMCCRNGWVPIALCFIEFRPAAASEPLPRPPAACRTCGSPRATSG